MMEAGVSSDTAAAAALVLISFCSFIAGAILRKWPERVREYVENLDGFVLLLSPEAHRALISASAIGLWATSAVALLAAAFLA